MMQQKILDEIIEVSNKYADKFNRQYEEDITRISDELINIDNDDFAFLLSQIENTNLSLSIRFSVFFVIFSKYRRNYQINDTIKIYTTYSELFKNEKLLIHLEVMMRAQTAAASELKELFVLLYESNILNKHIGATHHFAELVARYYESNLEELFLDIDSKKYITLATKLASWVVSERKEYHKFYCTLGRVKALNLEFDSGRRDILMAISLATNNSRAVVFYEDYLVQINVIQNYFNVKNELKKIDELQQKQEKDFNLYKDDLDKILLKFTSEIDNQKIDNFKIISIMAGVISFILGNVSFFSNINSTESIALLMLLFSSLFIIFLGIIQIFTTTDSLYLSFDKANGVVLSKKKKNKSYFVGLITISIGVLINLVVWLTL